MTNQNKPLEILFIGAGGIGSQCIALLSRSLAFGGLAEQVGGVHIHLMDADLVEQRNLPHQLYKQTEVGRPKVHAAIQDLIAAGVTGHGITFYPMRKNFRAGFDISPFDLVVVAVDRPEPRELVHKSAKAWLDLRCRGGGYIALDYLTDPAAIELLPKQEGAQSCQLPGAIESGNIQYGFAFAAAHGAEWCLQWVRKQLGEPTRTPPSRMFWPSIGEMPMPNPLEEHS
jgi:hypothetical protein